jgi:hypothetical protein
MAERPPSAESLNAEDVTVGPPRWVIVFGVAGLVLVLALLAIMLASGGRHGPGRHLRFGTPGAPMAPSGDSR